MNIDISERRGLSTDKIPALDSLYVYRSKRKGIKFNRHLNRGIGYRYTIKKAIFKAGEDEVYDYHRTAKIRGVEHGLVLVTKNSKFREVQKWFNEQITEIENDDKLFDRFQKAKTTPRELGIYYLY